MPGPTPGAAAWPDAIAVPRGREPSAAVPTRSRRGCRDRTAATPAHAAMH
jgi:hypothetical protein